MTSPRTKKFNSVLSTGKIKVTVCWDNKRCYSWQLLAKWTIVNTNRYAETLKNLNARLHQAHTQETWLKCHSMTTLSCTQVGTPQRPPSEILNGQCYQIHRIILTLPIRLLPILSSERKPVRTPLHQWWGTAKCHMPVGAEDGQWLLPGRNIHSCSKKNVAKDGDYVGK